MASGSRRHGAREILGWGSRVRWEEIVLKCSLSFAAIAVLVCVASQSEAAPFTPGNLVVTRVGDGVSALASTATPVFLDEYTMSGVLVQSIALPAITPGFGKRLLLAGSTGNSEGTLSRSGDGRFVTLAGYDAGIGEVVSSTSALAVNRVVARVDVCGKVDTSTAITDAPSGNSAPIRAAVTNDGSGYWFVGGGSSTGVRWTPNATQGSSVQIAVEPGNTRVVRIFDGQLFAATATASFPGVGSVGTGLPTIAGQISAIFFGLETNVSIYDFTIPSPAVMYVADDSATSRGLSKYVFNVGTGTWALMFRTALGLTPATVGLRRLCALPTSGGHDLFGLTDDGLSLVKFVDDGVNQTFVTIASAAPNTRLRGIDLVPTGTCCGADLDNDGTIATGVVPDGGVDINDLLAFLEAFEAGSVIADLDSDGIDPLIPDGGVDINDLLAFLSHFEAGC